jgi:hypothetical protein
VLDYSQREYGKNVLVFDDGGNGENSPAMLFKTTMCDRRSRGFERWWKGTIGERRWCAFRRIQNETTVRENIRRTL